MVADYTTDAKFVIPQIADILDPKKYEVLDRDIREGLGNILLNEEKFANTKIKMLVFIQKLNESRVSEGSFEDTDDESYEHRVQEYKSESVKFGDQGAEIGPRGSRNRQDLYRNKIRNDSQEEY